MNPLIAIIAAFASLKKDLYTRFNAALEGLGPVEQVEASQSVISVIREVDWARQRMEQVGTDLEAALTAANAQLAAFTRNDGEGIEVAAGRIVNLMCADAAATAVEAAIAAATHMPVEDHRTALETAVAAARAEVEQAQEAAFTARLEVVNAVAARRAQAVEDLGVSAASTLTDDHLAAENHADTVALLAARVTTMGELGITAEARPKGFASLLECPLDEAGSASFAARIELIKESAVLAVTAAAPATATPATTVPAIPAAAEEKRKPVI